MASIARADVFVVTDPRDLTISGTLRWALQSAKDNGNQPNWDTIRFNIPSGNPMARAIQLTSELPVVSSYLVIDGTTQLIGATFGSSDAKIAIFPSSYPVARRGLVLRNVDHVEIYGLLLAGFINNPPQINETWRDGIFMWNVHDIIIGAPSRGNAFFGCYHSIRHQAIPEDSRDPAPPGIGYNIIIQNNEIGKNNTGRPSTREGCVNGVELFDVFNVDIGGYTSGEENRFMIFLNAVQVSLKPTLVGNGSHVSVINNDFIVGTSTPALPVALPIAGISITNDAVNPGIHKVNISGNDLLLYTTGIAVAGLKQRFSIVNNVIDCDRANNNFGASIGIAVSNCDSGIIGGKDSINIIHDTKTFGISLIASKFITISRNKIYCDPKGININAPATVIPKITDLFIDAGGAAIGKTCAGCEVEVFDTRQCQGEYYNGENFLRTITADAMGGFVYSSSAVNCYNTSFTATNPAGTSSAFYVPYNFIFDTTAVLIQDASCGQNNGSIKNIKIFSGVDFYWEDLSGNVVGTDTNLVNVGAGFYRLVGTKQNLGCQLLTRYYEVKTVVPVINAANVLLTHPVPQCNRPGSITGIIVTGGTPGTFVYKWENQSGVIVGTALNLINVPAGRYTLTVSVSYDLSCFRTSTPFVLIDKPAPVVDIAAINLLNASCGLTNGSITGIAIINATGAQQFTWKDALGNTVGNTIDLLNVGAGNYQLIYDDASPCPPVNTAFFSIVNNGLVSIDESNKIIQPSGCTVIKGGIRNITVTGSNLLQWENVATGAVMGSNADLFPVPSGTYRLKAFDTNNGCSKTSSDIFVPLATVDPLAVQFKNSKDEFCSGANGFIKDIILHPVPVGYTYRWVKNTTDTFAFTLNINNIAKGDYELLGVDSNGCIQSVLLQTITDHPSPQINETGVVVKDDECTQANGSIKNLGIISGDAPYSYEWYAQPNNIFVVYGIDILKTRSGNFSMIVSDKNGCKDTSSILQVKDISPVIPPPVYDFVYAKRGGTALVRNSNGITGSYEIFDSPNSLLPIASNTSGTFRTVVLQSDKDYWVERVVGSCRSVRVKVHVNVIDYSNVFVPNAFTPNNDSKNDLLRIKVFGKIMIDGFTVYNRWGQQVFFTADVNKGWDGNKNGLPLPTAAYTWFIQGYDIDGTPIHLKGTVTLIR